MARASAAAFANAAPARSTSTARRYAHAACRCINGMIMQSAEFLATSKKPTEAEVKEALAKNLCRCGTHVRIVKAVMRAANA